MIFIYFEKSITCRHQRNALRKYRCIVVVMSMSTKSDNDFKVMTTSTSTYIIGVIDNILIFSPKFHLRSLDSYTTAKNNLLSLTYQAVRMKFINHGLQNTWGIGQNYNVICVKKNFNCNVCNVYSARKEVS